MVTITITLTTMILVELRRGVSMIPQLKKKMDELSKLI